MDRHIENAAYYAALEYAQNLNRSSEVRIAADAAFMEGVRWFVNYISKE